MARADGNGEVKAGALRVAQQMCAALPRALATAPNAYGGLSALEHGSQRLLRGDLGCVQR